MTTAAAPPPMSHPTANVLTFGFRTPLERVPENAANMDEHAELTLRAFSPRNGFHLWISDEIAMSMIHADRIGRRDRRLRDQSTLRAEFFWQEDRRLLAIELGGKLSAKPENTVAKLKATPQGCDWLIGRWGWLKAALDGGKAWGDADRATAFDLLGIEAAGRDASADRLADPARLVRDELAELEALKARVAESDALERSLAMTDMVDPNTKEYRSLKRAEGQIRRRMKWMIGLMDLMPRFADAHPDILEERGLKVAELVARENHRAAMARRAREQAPPPPPPAPTPPPTPPPLPEPWVRSAPPSPAPELPPMPPTVNRRPDLVKLRAKVRSDAARRRREDRPGR